MSVSKRGGFYHYKFNVGGKRYRGTTGQRTKDRAERVEQKVKDRIREAAHGLAAVRREDTPSFTAWAEIALRRWPRQSKAPAQLKNRVDVCLEFWGRRPKQEKKAPVVPRRGGPPDRPYHNYRLLDPILDPSLVLKFEDWMSARGISGSRKNQLRSTMSVLYKVAMKPAHRHAAKVETNPFAGVDRDKGVSRQRVLTLEEIEAWTQQAPYHLRVAMAIAVLAPKLRLGNILALRFDQHVDAALRTITVADHKADRTAPPLVVPVVDELRALLTFAKRHNRSAFVVEWEGTGVSSVRTAVRSSAEAAGFVYGRGTADGVTFHTLRHSMATWLATVPTLSERLRAEVMGQTVQTAQKYTHLAARHQVAAHEALAAATPIAGAIAAAVFGGRARGGGAGSTVVLRRVPRRRAVAISVATSDRPPATSPRKTGRAEGTAQQGPRTPNRR